MGCRGVFGVQAAGSPGDCLRPPLLQPPPGTPRSQDTRRQGSRARTCASAPLGQGPSATRPLLLQSAFVSRRGTGAEEGVCPAGGPHAGGSGRSGHPTRSPSRRRGGLELQASGSGERAGSWRRPRRGKLQPQLPPCWLREHPCAREHPKLPQAGAGRDGGGVSIGNQPGESCFGSTQRAAELRSLFLISPAPGCSLCPCKHPAGAASLPAAKAGGSGGSRAPRPVGPAPRSGAV